MRRIIALFLTLCCLISVLSSSIYAADDTNTKTFQVVVDTAGCEPQPQVTIKGNNIKKSETAKNTYIFETSTKWSADELLIALDASTEADDWLVDGTSYTKHEK